MSLLELEQITHSFGRGRQEVQVLERISLSVGKGEFVSLIGPSGSGKSTLFQMIGGLIVPREGRIVLDGREVTGQKGNISYMPQQPALFPWRSIESNVIVAQEIAGVPGRAARQQARKWLAQVGLAGYEQAYPHQLSGGMQQRAAFLRALLSPQELMCLDEPFSALDALTRMDMQRWLLEMWEQNRRSVLFVTHNIEEALLLSDTIYILSARPARVLERLTVPFPRPRKEEITAEPEFVRLRQQIYESMRV